MLSREYVKICAQGRADFFEAVKMSEPHNPTYLPIIQNFIKKFPAHDLNLGHFEENDSLTTHLPTHLHYCAANDNYPIFCELLKIDEVNVNAVNKDAETPLMIAVKCNHIYHVKELLSIPGINLEKVNEHGDSALHIAAKFGHTYIANALIAKGAKINLKNIAGNTPLILAAINGHSKTASALHEQNADLSMKNHENHTASWYAKQSDHPELNFLASKLEEFEKPEPNDVKSFEERLKDYRGDLKHDFCCPINQNLMVNPVTLSTSGYTYEMSALKDYVKGFPENEAMIPCPMTRVTVPRSEFEKPVVNVVLKNLIQHYVTDLEKMIRIKNTKFKLFAKDPKEEVAAHLRRNSR